ncbi:MAG: 50S ribosome-binding GTPase [Chloroflexi bacterium]|nr:50S ribosome-binding GTPase [Chloroflexota bacterium]
MPANLPPQYFEAERRFRNASTPEEKIQALESMLSIMPKHKGTDHLQADLRRKIAHITEEAEKKAATSRKSFYIRKEGAGQIALVGLPNTGKSLILASLTNVHPEIADYQFTTKSPNVGMMPFENIQIQIVDLPAVNMYESRIWSNSILRNADLLAIVVDLSNNPVEQADITLKELENMAIVPENRNAEDSTIGLRTRKMFIIGNMGDLDLDDAGVKSLQSKYGRLFDSIKVSADSKENLEELKRQLFAYLDIIRIHTKSPGVKVDLTDPIVLKKGATVKDAAESVHKDFKSKLRYAVLWGSSKFDGQRVGQDHILRDNDVIELHI